MASSLTEMEIDAAVAAEVRHRSRNECEVGHRGCGRNAWLYHVVGGGEPSVGGVLHVCRPCDTHLALHPDEARTLIGAGS